MRNKLMIIGAGGHGKVVADIAFKLNNWKEIVFVDDNDNLKECMGFKVACNISTALNYILEYDIFVAIGNNKIREKIQKQFELAGASIPTIIHPSVVLGENVNLGIGSVVMAGVVINCCTDIGKGCIINTCCNIDHDNIIGDYVHISPGVSLAGSISVGKYTWIGIGCSVINNVKIIDNCVLGAGSVVVADITKSGTYVGVPVRRI